MGSFYRLTRNTVLTLKLKMIYINSKKCNDSNKMINKRLILDDINNSKIELLKYSQKESFQKEFNEILHNEPLEKSKLISFSHFSEDGLIRVGGTIVRSSRPFSGKHQIMLSYDHPLSALLITYIYKIRNHSGTGFISDLRRESFLIIKSENFIDKILNKR